MLEKWYHQGTCSENVESIKKSEKNRVERDDYVMTSGIGWHKIYTNAKNWNDARKSCIQDGAQLAILNSKNEEKVNLHSFFTLAKTKVYSRNKKKDTVLSIRRY